MRYLKGASEKELCYRKCDNKELRLWAYRDADWTGNVTDRLSTTGYCISMAVNGSLILWKTKKQPTVALSTCEDEYMALSTTSQECLYLTQLLRGIDEQKYAP